MEHGTFAILATLFLTTAAPLGTGFQFTPTKRTEHEYILASHIRAYILEQGLKPALPSYTLDPVRSQELAAAHNSLLPSHPRHFTGLFPRGGARNPNLQVVITHASHVCCQPFSSPEPLALICNEPRDQERRALGTRMAVVWTSTKNKWNAQNAI